MNYSPTAHIIAVNAQRRQFDGVRLDGPVIAQRPIGTVRTALARLLDRASYRLAPAVPQHRVAA